MIIYYFYALAELVVLDKSAEYDNGQCDLIHDKIEHNSSSSMVVIGKGQVIIDFLRIEFFKDQ